MTLLPEVAAGRSVDLPAAWLTLSSFDVCQSTQLVEIKIDSTYNWSRLTLWEDNEDEEAEFYKRACPVNCERSKPIDTRLAHLFNRVL